MCLYKRETTVCNFSDPSKCVLEFFLDPWLYRERRAVQTKAEKLQYDQHRVVLLETLGNARMDHSYDYIISHINTTNSPWIKRAGVHALRKYEHHMVRLLI
jgi:hypothetical protein